MMGNTVLWLSQDVDTSELCNAFQHAHMARPAVSQDEERQDINYVAS